MKYAVRLVIHSGYWYSWAGEVGISELSLQAEATVGSFVNTVVMIADFHFHFPFAPHDWVLLDARYLSSKLSLFTAVNLSA